MGTNQSPKNQVMIVTGILESLSGAGNLEQANSKNDGGGAGKDAKI